MKPLAPVTRQTSSRERSIGSPRSGVQSSAGAARGTRSFVGRRRSVAVAISRTTPQFLLPEPSQSVSTASSASRNSCASGSESVSGGSSLITSFLPAAIVITPWSRCSGMTTSCGNRPSLAMWIRRQLIRAPRELGAPSSIPTISPLARTSLISSWRSESAARPSSSTAPIRAACSTRPSRSMIRIVARPAAIDRRLRP